jgi:regulatory protein
MAEPDPRPDGGRRAFELAVGAITRKERTISELREWLGARDLHPDDVEATVNRLIEIGELDDEKFARLYAEDKRELRGWGPERIRETLIGRGIDSRTAGSAAAAESSEDQIERAEALLLKRGTNAGEESGRAKALAFLARRGYDYDVAYAAIRRLEREAA